MRFNLPNEVRLPTSDVLLIHVSDDDSGMTLMKESTSLLVMPKNLRGLSQPVSIQILSVEKSDDVGSATVSLVSDRMAVYIVLTTRAQGRFLDNVFALRANQEKVYIFIYMNTPMCDLF